MTTPSNDANLLTTSISRNWLIKMAIFLIALAGFGTWGLVDALVIYPRKGLEDASFKLKAYLQAASSANRLSPAFLKLDDPKADLAALATRESIQKNTKNLAAVKEPLTDVESAKLAWLRSLDRAWKLAVPENPIGSAPRNKLAPGGTEVYSGVGGSIDAQKETHRLFFRTRDGTGVNLAPDGKRSDLSPDQTLKDLSAYWTSQKKTPSSLEFYDLPSQWLFVAIGYGGALYILFLLLSVSRRSFRFDPASTRLFLPSGDSISPADLTEVDKRRWHKFFVTLVTKSGRSHTLDLLRYVPLEDWVLDLERKAFPDQTSPDDPDASASGDHYPGSTDAPTTPKLPKDIGAISAMTYGGVPDGVFALLLFDPAPIPDNALSLPAYAQAETLKALAAALAKDRGWNFWLTAGAGSIGGTNAPVGGGPSLGLRSLIDWLDNKAFGYHIDHTRIDPTFLTRLRSLSSDSSLPALAPYAIAIGRLSQAVAANLHDVMLDPPTTGYAGLIIIKSTPASIERITQPLELHAGLEIKATACVGPWLAPPAEIDAAGLSLSDTTSND